MKHIEICPDVWELPLGGVKAYLINCQGSLTLIDTGMPGHGEKILEAVEDLGFRREDLRHILITHFHMDHIGSLTTLKELTGASVHAHKKEAATIGTIQHTEPAPGFMKKLVFNLLIRRSMGTPQPELPVDEVFDDGDVLDFAGGLRIIGTPGHTQGHTSFMIDREGGILIVGDAASGGKKPGYPFLFSNEKEALKTLAMVGTLNFRMACFSHGKSIARDAPAKFRAAFHRQVL